MDRKKSSLTDYPSPMLRIVTSFKLRLTGSGMASIGGIGFMADNKAIRSIATFQLILDHQTPSTAPLRTASFPSMHQQDQNHSGAMQATNMQAK